MSAQRHRESGPDTLCVWGGGLDPIDGSDLFISFLIVWGNYVV